MSQPSVQAREANRFERRKGRTRQEILRAAEQVLASKGFFDAKIADIAEAADVGVGTVYLHFDTKEALFEAVVEDAVGRLKEAVDGARAGARSAVDDVRAATGAFCRFADANRAVFRIVFGHGGTYHDVIRRTQALFAADVEQTVRRGVADGVFRVTAPALAAHALVGMSTQLLAWWAEREATPIETIEETIVALTLGGLGGTHKGA